MKSILIKLQGMQGAQPMPRASRNDATHSLSPDRAPLPGEVPLQPVAAPVALKVSNHKLDHRIKLLVCVCKLECS